MQDDVRVLKGELAASQQETTSAQQRHLAGRDQMQVSHMVDTSSHDRTLSFNTCCHPCVPDEGCTRGADPTQ